MEQEISIYNMRLFQEKIIQKDTNCAESMIRVPGGWIYIVRNKDNITSSFVPYCSELI